MIKIKMALGIGNENILFIREDKRGLYLGTKENYKTLGEYSGELLKLCDNEENYIFYSLLDILTKADDEKEQEKLKIIYKILQS